MRAGRTLLEGGRGTGFAQAPAWPRRAGAGLAALSCCLFMLAALDANLAGLLRPTPRRETRGITLFMPAPIPSTTPRSPPGETRRTPSPHAAKAMAPAPAAEEAAPRMTPLPMPAPPMPPPSLPTAPPIAVTPMPDEGMASALASYQRQLWARIAARRPAGLHLSGTAMVRFALERDGALRSAALAASSGSTVLDRLALRTVRAAGPFPTPPAGLDDNQLVFTIAFSFH